MKFDITEIGEIHCTLNFDEDWYNDYLRENGLSNSQEVFQNYVREQCDYEIEYYDSETFHSMGEYETMTIDEIEENFGSAIARDVFNECMDGREHSFEILAYQNDTVDINNPEELNAAAVKVLRHGDYFKGCRGFILTNGVVVYTESEHNNCTRISGVKGTSHFIELGNIRVLDHSIDICKKPTPQQIKVLWEVLDSYYGDVLYLDLLNKNIGNFSQQYQSCNPERVMNDITSYFSNKKRVFETVKYLLNKELKENMKKTSTDSAAPATFDEYMDLNTHQDDLAQIGVNPVEWNTDNFLDGRKYMNRAREILRANPSISPVDAEMKIMAIRAAIRKCAITDVEKRETYNIELHAYKLLKDWLMNNYRGNKKMKNISENKNMKKNVVKINENALKQMVAESVKKALKEAFEPYDLGYNPQFCHIKGDILLSEEDAFYFQRQLKGSFSARKATDEDLRKFRDVRSGFSDTPVY